MTQIIKKSKRLSGAADAVMQLSDIARQVNEVVLDARKTAARISAEARAKAELTRQQARQQGYDEGFAQGREQGVLDGAKEGAEQARSQIAGESKGLTQLAGSIMSALDGSSDRPYELASDEVLAFTLELATKIVGQLARTDISVARSNLVKAMKLAHAEGEIIVSVNPAQLQGLSRDFAEFVEVIDAAGRTRLVADEQVGPGGVKITTARGVIDATVETQLAKVASALAADGLAGSHETPGKTDGVPSLRMPGSDGPI
ncbi:MAG: hypothetical protein HN350_03385 [Phycisphaerales bacterium]|jgi:flagellar assembly protein FliH|nr:hypothetical protein [Phycisphaerales bacterium]